MKFMPKDTSTPDTDPLRPRTQTWLGSYVGNVKLANEKKDLASLDLTLQPVVASQASGWLKSDADGLSHTDSDALKTVFTLAMSGMAPNFMTMRDLSFIAGTKPVEQQQFGASFGVLPSTCKFSLSGDPLPEFLEFSPQTGVIKPSGKEAAPSGKRKSAIDAQNPLGKASAAFSIDITTSGVKIAFA